MKSKRQMLLDWFRKSKKKYIRTSDVIKWGIENYSNRSERDARSLREEGHIVRLSKEEKLAARLKTKEDLYQVL